MEILGFPVEGKTQTFPCPVHIGPFQVAVRVQKIQQRPVVIYRIHLQAQTLVHILFHTHQRFVQRARNSLQALGIMVFPATITLHVADHPLQPCCFIPGPNMTIDRNVLPGKLLQERPDKKRPQEPRAPCQEQTAALIHRMGIPSILMRTSIHSSMLTSGSSSRACNRCTLTGSAVSSMRTNSSGRAGSRYHGIIQITFFLQIDLFPVGAPLLHLVLYVCGNPVDRGIRTHLGDIQPNIEGFLQVENTFHQLERIASQFHEPGIQIVILGFQKGVKHFPDFGMNPVRRRLGNRCFLTGRGVVPAAEEHFQAPLQVVLPDLVCADLAVVRPGQAILFDKHHIVEREFKMIGHHMIDP